MQGHVGFGQRQIELVVLDLRRRNIRIAILFGKQASSIVLCGPVLYCHMLV